MTHDILEAQQRHLAQLMEATSDWQRCRAVRNMAAHEYATHYADIAEHFNLLQELSAVLFHAARRLIIWCTEQLGIPPASRDFSPEFERIFV